MERVPLLARALERAGHRRAGHHRARAPDRRRAAARRVGRARAHDRPAAGPLAPAPWQAGFWQRLRARLRDRDAGAGDPACRRRMGTDGMERRSVLVRLAPALLLATLLIMTAVATYAAAARLHDRERDQLTDEAHATPSRRSTAGWTTTARSCAARPGLFNADHDVTYQSSTTTSPTRTSCSASRACRRSARPPTSRAPGWRAYTTRTRAAIAASGIDYAELRALPGAGARRPRGADQRPPRAAADRQPRPSASTSSPSPTAVAPRCWRAGRASPPRPRRSPSPACAARRWAST